MSRSRIASIKDVWDLVKSDGLNEKDFLAIEHFFQNSEKVKDELNRTESPHLTNGEAEKSFSGFSSTNRVVNEDSQSQDRSLFHYLAEHVPFAEDEKSYADFIQKLMRMEIAKEVNSGFQFPFVFLLDSKKQTPLDIALDLNPNPNNVFIRAVEEVINERYKAVQQNGVKLNKRKKIKAKTLTEQAILQETLIAHRELGEFNLRREEKTVAKPTLTPATRAYLKKEKSSRNLNKPGLFSKSSRKNVNLEQLFTDFQNAALDGMTEAQFNEFLMKFSGNINAKDPRNNYSLLHYLVFYHSNQCPYDAFIVELIRDFGANPNALYGDEGTSVKDFAGGPHEKILLSAINKAQEERSLPQSAQKEKVNATVTLLEFKNLAKDANRNREVFPKEHMSTFNALYKAAGKDGKAAEAVSEHLYKIGKSLVEDKHRNPAYKKEAAQAFKLLLKMEGKNPQLDALKKEACAYLRKHYRFAKKYDLIPLRNLVNKELGVKAKSSIYEKGHMTLMSAKNKLNKLKDTIKEHIKPTIETPTNRK